MSSFSSCPKCAKPITLPRGAEPVDMVRCPLCQSEYMLAEALANAPPELLILRTLAVVNRDEAHEAPASEGGTDLHLFEHASSGFSDGPDMEEPTIDLSESPLAVGDDLDLEINSGAGGFDHHASDEPATIEIDPSAGEALPVDLPLGDSEPDLAGSFDSAERDTELEPSIAGSSDDESFDLDSPGLAFDMAAGADEQPEGSDAQENPADDDLVAFGGEDDDIPSLDVPATDEAEMGFAEAKTATDEEELATTPRRVRRRPSVVVSLFMWATSALTAAVVAYAVLLWLVHTDPLGLGPKLPKFMVPAAFANPAAAPKQIALATPAQPATPPADEAPDQALPSHVTAPNGPGGATGDVPAASNDGSTEPADAGDAAADDTTTPADAPDTDPAADSSADEPATEDTMPEEPSADEPSTEGPATDEPADTEPAEADSPETTPAEDAAMDDEPSDTDTPAAETPDAEPSDAEPADAAPADAEPSDDMADDSTAQPADAATPDTADVATDDSADVPGSDLAAPETAAAVGPRDSVSYSADEMEKALTETRDASTALAGADKDGLKKAKAQYYRKLYQLAELATFPETNAIDPQPDLGQIQKLLTDAAADRARFTEIGKAAGKWIAVSKGKEHQGVVLSGTVQSVTKQGQVYETKVLLTDGAQVVSVLSAQKLPVDTDDQAVVLGSIVSDPATAIDGYQGAEPTAVWSGVAIKVPASG